MQDIKTSGVDIFFFLTLLRAENRHEFYEVLITVRQ
jgi:hypothetical protein